MYVKGTLPVEQRARIGDLLLEVTPRYQQVRSQERSLEEWLNDYEELLVLPAESGGTAGSVWSVSVHYRSRLEAGQRRGG